MSNVRFQVAVPELRPAMILDHVEDAAVNGFSVQAGEGAGSVLRFIDTRDVLLTAARLLNPAKLFLEVEGRNSGTITIEGGDLSKAAKLR